MDGKEKPHSGNPPPLLDKALPVRNNLNRHREGTCGAAFLGKAFPPPGAARHPIILFKEDRTMADVCGNLHVGDQVPDFELETFDPVRKDFGKISLKKLKAAKKWTVLFFYPADFTFV
jgi:hypothetical protein